MIIDIKEGVFEINTFESYNKEIYFFDKNVIIPYITLQIFDNNLTSNKFKKYDKLDFSYLIFMDVKEIIWKYEGKDKVNHEKFIFNPSSDDNNYLIDHIEATGIFAECYGYDFEIKFKKQYLYFSEDVGIISGPLSYWIPVDTPNFKRNMNEQQVQSFFTKNSIPTDVLRLVGAIDPSMLKTLDVTKSKI